MEVKITPNTFIKINKETSLGFIKISNFSLERKAFKIKTTKPKNYLVKPSIGIVQPNEEIIIEVNILEIIKIDDQHKFAVEIYEVNWRQNLETLKRYLKTTQISPLVIHRLNVQYEDLIKTEASTIETEDFYISYLCLIYLTGLCLILFFQLFKNVD